MVRSDAVVLHEAGGRREVAERRRTEQAGRLDVIELREVVVPDEAVGHREADVLHEAVGDAKSPSFARPGEPGAVRSQST